jgi:hypothetical protein
MSGTIIAREIKEEIITKIKTEGITGMEAARRYGVNVKAITRNRWSK